MTFESYRDAGPPIFHIDTAASTSELHADYLMAGTLAIALDTGAMQVYNGSAWVEAGVADAGAVVYDDPSGLTTATEVESALDELFAEVSGIQYKEDFIGDHVAEDSSVLINQSGTPTTAAAVGTAAGGALAGHGGWLAGSVDNVDAEIDEVALGAKPWVLVSAVPTIARCELGFVIPAALTARQYFFGWTDDETEGTATNGPLNIQTGTTVVDVATDAAGFIFSSLATDADGFYMANTNGGTQALVGNSGLTGVVDEYIRLRVDIAADGTATFYGATDTTRAATLPLLGTQASAVATTAVLLPVFTAAATADTAVEWEIDYIKASVL